MDRTMAAILADIQKKVEQSDFTESKKTKFKSEIDYLKEKYENLEVKEKYKEVHDSLVKKGKELVKNPNIYDIKKVEFYLNYCHAALYDLQGNLKPLNMIVRVYILSCILFLALAPQYFSFVLPLLFLLPIFLGLKGLKRRSKTGYLYALTVMPMAVLTSVTAIRNTYLASKDFNNYVTEFAKEINRSPQFIKNFTIFFTLLAVVLLISSISTIVLGAKHRKMFI